MKTYPLKEKRSKTGSNLRANHLRTNHKKLQGAQERPLRRLTLEYQRQCKKLFSKADLRLADAIASDVRSDWQKSNLQSVGDAAQWEERKKNARARINRRLAKALPQYRQWQALRRSHLRGYQKLASVSLGPLGRWDVVAPPPVGPVRSFSAPFNTYDVYTIDDSGMILEDQSFVRSDKGEIVNDLVFQHDEDTAIILGVFGLDGRDTASGLASCGVNFTMPQDGRLQVTAELQNHYNPSPCP